MLCVRQWLVEPCGDFWPILEPWITAFDGRLSLLTWVGSLICLNWSLGLLENCVPFLNNCLVVSESVQLLRLSSLLQLL